jgi:hypothetical protein
MLDRLLGRAELKDRIAELETENERLRRQAESADESRAEAVSARQEAQERINQMEDRITELEDRVERAGEDERGVEYYGTAQLRGARLDEVLARLRSLETDPEGALTAMVRENPPAAVTETLGERAALVRRSAPCLVLADDERLVSVALSPPRTPDPFTAWDDGFQLQESWFRPTEQLTFALVRSDLFAMGEYDGSQLRGAESFESDVRDKHSKGGFSQARFERRREDQIDDHVQRCRETLRERAPETLIVVGDAQIVSSFSEEADETATVDASGDPDEALRSAFRSFWTTKLYLL